MTPVQFERLHHSSPISLLRHFVQQNDLVDASGVRLKSRKAANLYESILAARARIVP